MTSRRAFSIAAALIALAPKVSLAQTSPRRIGVLHAGSSNEPPHIQREPFERGLRENAFHPGRNIIIDYRYAEGDASRLKELADELIKAKVDVVVARGNMAIDAARMATRTIPIVMSAWAGDPVASGVVRSFARPGGNITGISGLVELDGKRLEMLKEVVPSANRIGILGNPEFGATEYEQQIAAVKKSARRLGMEVLVFEVRKTADIAGAFASMDKSSLHALLVRGDPQVMDPNRTDIVARVAVRRLPAMYWWPFFVQAGGLISYGESFPAFHHGSAQYVSRILRGAHPGDLAIQQPTTFELAINLKTAKTLGVEIPKHILLRADQIIQ